MEDNYQKQLRKWAAAKFDIDINKIASVDLIEDTIYGGYCDTCRYEDDAYKVTVYSRKEGHPVLHQEKVAVYDFVEFLKQIINA